MTYKHARLLDSNIIFILKVLSGTNVDATELLEESDRRGLPMISGKWTVSRDIRRPNND